MALNLSQVFVLVGLWFLGHLIYKTYTSYKREKDALDLWLHTVKLKSQRRAEENK